MDSITVDDMNVSMDDPEGGCIVQADDPQMLVAADFDGSSGSSGNNSWYWSSMLKLMEQGAATSCSTSSNPNVNNNYTTSGAHVVCGQQPLTAERRAPPSASSPSSSSVHDQPLDILPQDNAMNASDPDSSVWGQEFLSGPIGESKVNHHVLASSTEDGLHELLYPRTVLELLFSDQLKLEQMPSWPDILQHTLSGAGPPKTSHENMNMDPPQLDTRFPQYNLQNYPHPSTAVDDRLSSSAASSTLSDTAIDQWAPAAAAQCEHAMQTGHPNIAMQQSDSNSLGSNTVQEQIASGTVRVKQECNHALSPPFCSTSTTDSISNYANNTYSLHQQRLQQNQRAIMTNAAAGSSGFDEAMINMNQECIEMKPSVLLNKLWSNAVIHAATEPLSQIKHKHHIYESITAANFSHNLRQVAGLNGNGFLGVGDPLHVRGSNLHNFINGSQPSQQLGKKSRPFPEGEPTTMGKASSIEPKKEMEDSKANSNGAGEHEPTNSMLASHMHNNNIPLVARGSGCSSMHTKQQQQLSSAEYTNFKRSRTDQAAPTISTTNSSSSFLKSQPVRKEKLTERITALQQIVNPYGKTDTASVLLEAIGYIKFLQDQVQQALSSPYFKSPSNQSGDYSGDEGKPDLRSRGLCLVPLSCTMQMANDNGADYWFGGAFR